MTPVLGIVVVAAGSGTRLGAVPRRNHRRPGGDDPRRARRLLPWGARAPGTGD